MNFSITERERERDEAAALSDPANWLGIREASREYDVALSYLYKIAYDGVPGLTVRTETKETGKIRREVRFYKPDLEQWAAGRPARFKKKGNGNGESA